MDKKTLLVGCRVSPNASVARKNAAEVWGHPQGKWVSQGVPQFRNRPDAPGRNSVSGTLYYEACERMCGLAAGPLGRTPPGPQRSTDAPLFGPFSRVLQPVMSSSCQARRAGRVFSGDSLGCLRLRKPKGGVFSLKGRG